MAPKRLLEDPPPATSSTEEEEESEDDAAEEEENGVSEGVQDEEEDGHQNKKPTTNKSTVTTSLKASERQSSSDSGDESGSETDSESDKSQPSPSASDFTIKPIVSKPMDDSGKPQKRDPKRKLTLGLAATATGGKKRTGQSDIEGKESKKNKLSNGQEEDLKKGSGVQRLWSGEDEIAILKGMIEYQSKKGADPSADMEAFHGFIKKSLHADVSKNQLMSKIKRLKKKYRTSAEKGENGEDPVFSKPHEHKFFDLCKKIWGAASTSGVDDNAKNKRKPTRNRVKAASAVASPNGEVNTEPASSCPNSTFLEGLLLSGKLLPQSEPATNIMKEALPLLGSTKVKELESKWRKLQEDQCLLYLKKLELEHESAELLLEAMKSSKF